MLRLAMLGNFPLRPENPYGGVEAVVGALTSALARRGDVDVHVGTTRSDVDRTRVVQLDRNLTVHYMPRVRRLELATSFLHDRVLLGKWLRQLDPDVVHAHELGRYAYACARAKRPYILTVHGVPSIERRLLEPRGLRNRARLALVRKIESVCFRRASALVANSTYVIGQMPVECRVRTTLVRNPVDPAFFAAHEQSGYAGRITFVGRINRLKGVDVLVRSLPLVRAQFPYAHVRLVGPTDDHQYQDELQHLADQSGVRDAVSLAGPRHGSALVSEYAEASVVALPSRQENAPVSIAEAMSVGRPIIATAVGGVPDLVAHGTTGLLCRSGDVRELSDALITLLDDTSLAARMGRAGQMIAREHFHPDAVAARHWSIYQSIADQEGKPRRAQVEVA